MAIRTDADLLSIGAHDSRNGAGLCTVHGKSEAMRAVERMINDIAGTDIPVLLVGESGTGKEILALEIHRLSRRWKEPFVKCGCAGANGDFFAGLLRCGEGAREENPGTSGSLFLDGVNHLDVNVQARLLHVLPDSNGTPAQGCGSARVISSTTRNLEEEIQYGRFREELYYRINGVQLRLPPLRERKEDLPLLLEFFLKKYSSLFERPEPALRESTMDLLLRHNWPGNIRELENVARKIVALGDEVIATHDLLAGPAPRAGNPAPHSDGITENGQNQVAARSLKEAAREASRQAERALILNQLERTHWNRKRAARDLQISYKALLYKLKQLGLDNPSRPEKT